MTYRVALQILDEIGVIAHGHTQYSSGKHGDKYINKYAIYPDPRYVSTLCRLLAQAFAYKEIDVVVGAETGGFTLAYEIARQLSSLEDYDALWVPAFNDEVGYIFKSGHELIAGKKVLIVQDVLNTGNTVKHLIQAVKDFRGHAVGVGVICNRGKVSIDNIDLVSLVDLDLDIWDPFDCPLCKKNIPLRLDLEHA